MCGHSDFLDVPLRTLLYYPGVVVSAVQVFQWRPESRTKLSFLSCISTSGDPKLQQFSRPGLQVYLGDAYRFNTDPSI